MRRLGGRRSGALVSLSVVVALGLSTGVSASAAPDERSVSVGGAGDRSKTDKPGLSRAGAGRAQDAERVQLPRPVRGAAAIRLLGDQLDEAAALNDLSESDLVELLRSDSTVWLDRAGLVFFIDEPAPAPTNDPTSAQAPLDQTFLLHSKPGAQRSIYLDFDGGTASNTSWHANAPATPSTQPAWDPSGNGASFDNTELAKIQTVWQSVAEDYAPFDVDVTTADPGAAGIFRANAADQTFGSHVLITPSVGAHDAICGGCGGVAYLNVFDTVNGNGGGAAGDGYGYMQPAWVFPHQLGNSPKNIAEAASHEVGHNFGLSHDGNASQGYDTGHGSWAPIMGVGYSHPISQWSKGDYAGANNTEDDVAKIRSVTGSRVDEAGTSIASARTVPTDTAYVSSRTDIDTYLLGTCTGSVTLTATPDTYANLDIQLTLRDVSGAAVATADPASTQSTVSLATGMDASLTQAVATGTYYVSVDGVGNGTPVTGYDDYGSIGAYTLAATGCNGAPPAGTASAPTSVVATSHATDPSITLGWAAPTSAGTSAVSGYILTRSGSDTPIQVASTVRSYAWTGLDSGVAYSFTITAISDQGPGATATAGATTAASVPTVPQNVTASWNSLGQRAYFGFSAPTSNGGLVVTAYDIFVDGVYTYQVAGTGTYLIPLAPGTHTLAVAAKNSLGRSPFAQASVVTPARPANDAFALRTTMSGVSGTVSGDNLESSSETGEPSPTATRANPGSASLWYSWTASAAGPVTMTTTSTVTDRDTTLDVYTGTTVGGLTRVVGNDEPGGSSHLASVAFTATAGTTYAVAVNGYRTFAAGVGAFTLNWSGTAPAPAASTTTTLGSAITGRSTTLTANVAATSGSPAGTVEFRDGGVLVGTQAVSSGTASVTVSDLVRGDHPYRATFVPTDSSLFTSSQSTIVTSTIAGTTTTTSLQATSGINTVNLAAAVTAAAGTATGTVTFKEGTTTVGSATVSAGNAAVYLTSVSAGSHTYTATFVPADVLRYDGSTSAARTVAVADPPPAATTSTTLNASASGRVATLTAAVTAASGTPAGEVQFRDGGTVVGTVTIASGAASLQVSDLLRGTHTFTAEFVPTNAAAYAASQSADSVVEIAATPTTTFLTTSVSGRSVTLSSSVSPSVAGTVQFREGSTLVGTVTLAAGAAQLTLSNVPAGDHTYTASFVPADGLRHAPSTSADKTVTVLATPTSTALGSSVSNHRVTLTATVTSGIGSPAGSVEFRDGTTVVATTSVSAGTASAVLDDVTTGSHSYTATFLPSAPTSYAGSVSSAQNVTVVATATTTGLTASNSGRTVTLTATPTTGNGTLAGSVQFHEGSTLVGTVALGVGSTVLTLTSVSPGSHSYTATFIPSSTSHAGSTSPLRSVTVQVSSTTGLTASTTGRNVTLDASVTTDGGTPVGNVELRDGSTLVGTHPVAAGAASLTLTDVAPGGHTYTATFVPTDTAAYVGSSSPARSVTVARIATTTTLAASVTGRTVTLTATPNAASGTLTGAVEFREGTTVLDTVNLSGGGATLSLSNVAPGDHTYTATFVPTGSTHAGSTSDDRMVSIDRIATTTTLGAVASGRSVTLTATTSAASGAPAGTIEFREGTDLLGSVALDGGTAALTLTGVAPGSHDYRATFVPTGTTHAGSLSPTATTTVAKVATSTDLTASVTGRAVTLTATTTTGSGTLTGSVEFRDGATLRGTVPLTAGSAVLDLTSVLPGSHDYTATFVPAGTFHSGSTSPARTRTVQVSSTTGMTAGTVGRNVTLDVTVTTDGGTPAGTVQFREDGVLLDTKPVASGAASLTLTDVAPGDHTYTSTFVPTDTAAYTGSVSPVRTVTVDRQMTTIDLATSVTGRAVMLTATTPDDVAGTVSFLDGGIVVATAITAGGTVSRTLAGVATGTHAYRATFAPDDIDSYFPSSSPVRSTTLVATTTTTGLTASVSGSTISFDVRVSSTDGVPDGVVAITEGGIQRTTAVVTAGRAVFALGSVSAGTHTYVAIYGYTAGGSQFAASSSEPVTVAVSDVAPAAPTSTTLTASAVRRTVTLQADVTSPRGTPFGSVQFKEDGFVVATVALVDGVATLTRPAVSAGSRSYTAEYVPGNEAAYSASASASVPLTVQKTVTTTTLDGAVNGSTVTLDIVVAGTDGIVPTGQVRVFSGSTEVGTVQLAGGTGRLVLASVAVGIHGYRAVFGGGADLAASESNSVEKTVTAPVTPPPTPPATEPPVTTVPPGSTVPPATLLASTTKVVAPKKAKLGTRPVVTVSVARGSAAASGKVVITIGTKSKTLTLKAGAAKLKLPKLKKKGKVKITVRYLGDASTAPSTTTWTIKVKPA